MNRIFGASLMAFILTLNSVAQAQVSYPREMRYRDGTPIRFVCGYYHKLARGAAHQVVFGGAPIEFEFYYDELGTFEDDLGTFDFKSGSELKDPFILAVAVICLVSLRYVQSQSEKFGDVERAEKYLYENDIEAFNRFLAANNSLLAARWLADLHKDRFSTDSSFYLAAREADLLEYFTYAQEVFGGPEMYNIFKPAEDVSLQSKSTDSGSGN